MTSCPLRRLQELAPRQDEGVFSPAWWEPYASNRPGPDVFAGLVGNVRVQAPTSVRPADGRRAHFTLRGAMAENGSLGLREERGDD